MNRELEGLVLALDAVIEAPSGSKALDLEAIFNARIEDTLTQHPELTREQLLKVVDLQYRRWLKSQHRPPSIPPKA